MHSNQHKTSQHCLSRKKSCPQMYAIHLIRDFHLLSLSSSSTFPFSFGHYIISFLVACTRLYKPLCPSVGLSVNWSVCLSVCRWGLGARDLWQLALFLLFACLLSCLFPVSKVKEFNWHVYFIKLFTARKSFTCQKFWVFCVKIDLTHSKGEKITVEIQLTLFKGQHQCVD